MDSDKFLSLITSQHKDKPKFIATVKASIDPIIDAIDCMNAMNEKFVIDEANGDQLQIIADWLGAANAIPNSIPIPFFGFEDQPESLTWAETDDLTIGGYWRESGISDYTSLPVDSILFKRIVKAKILLNRSDCTEQSAMEIIRLVLDKNFNFKDNLNMTISFNFLEEYEVWERELVVLMFPLPSGARLLFGGEDDY